MMASAAPVAETPAIFTLDQLKKLYQEAKDATDPARKDADLAFDYYDNKQWTSKQIKALRDRKQPEIWINLIAPAVNGMDRA